MLKKRKIFFTLLCALALGFSWGFLAHKYHLFPWHLLSFVSYQVRKTTEKPKTRTPYANANLDAAAGFARLKQNLPFWKRTTLPNCSQKHSQWIGDSLFDFFHLNSYFTDTINFGTDGLMTKMLVNRLELFHRCESGSIYLYLGGNDLDWQYPAHEIIPFYRRIVESLRTTNRAMYLLGIHRGFATMARNHFVDQYNDDIEAIAKEFDLIFIPSPGELYDEQNNLKPEFAIDGEHLTNLGYEVWAKQIAKFSQSHLQPALFLP